MVMMDGLVLDQVLLCGNSMQPSPTLPLVHSQKEASSSPQFNISPAAPLLSGSPSSSAEYTLDSLTTSDLSPQTAAAAATNDALRRGFYSYDDCYTGGFSHPPRHTVVRSIHQPPSDEYKLYKWMR
jgi:hypothetical protein